MPFSTTIAHATALGAGFGAGLGSHGWPLAAVLSSLAAAVAADVVVLAGPRDAADAARAATRRFRGHDRDAEGRPARRMRQRCVAGSQAGGSSQKCCQERFRREGRPDAHHRDGQSFVAGRVGCKIFRRFVRIYLKVLVLVYGWWVELRWIEGRLPGLVGGEGGTC